MTEIGKKPKVSFKFGTPKPVSFREKAGGEFDVDMEARVAMAVDVYEYDADKYGGTDGLVNTLKAGMFDLTEKCLDQMSEKSVMRSSTQTRLADHLKKELSLMGVEAEINVFSFVLTEDSRKQYDELKKYVYSDMPVDRTDRPCREYLEKFKPDCVLQGDPNRMNDPFFTNRQRYDYCIECGAKREENANYCTKCGYKFPV